MNATYWIIEKSGESRQVWGPYKTLAHAEKEAGNRHEVVRGSGLENGMTMTRGEFTNAARSGRIYSAVGANLI